MNAKRAAVRQAQSYAEKRILVPAGWAGKVRVLVLGCGGSGSEMVDALVRVHHSMVGLGHEGLSISLQDGDTVSPSNVGRARFLPSDVGMNKAALLARRYGLLFGLDIKAYENEATAKNIREFSQCFDLIITCVDRASFRTRIARWWSGRKSDALWLDVGNGSHSGQSLLGHLGNPEHVPRLPNVLDLFPAIATTPDDDAPSCSMADALRSQQLFVNRWVVDAACAMLWRLFSDGYLETHGAVVDMKALRMTPIQINRASWEFFGFKVPAVGGDVPKMA